MGEAGLAGVEGGELLLVESDRALGFERGEALFFGEGPVMFGDGFVDVGLNDLLPRLFGEGISEGHRGLIRL